MVLLIEAATNPRVLDEAGRLALVRPEDRISGPGSTPIMAAFTHAQTSRFGDGSYGVFYAAFERETAIAETAYHRSRFLRDARLPSERLDMRMYAAAVRGSFEDLRDVALDAAVYDPDSYAASQAYGRRVHDANVADGIVYRSVRRSSGTCVAVLRPRCISSVQAVAHLEYRFEDYTLTGVYALEELE
jgi:hypothetical protein